jgi:hypothetical protein
MFEAGHQRAGGKGEEKRSSQSPAPVAYCSPPEGSPHHPRENDLLHLAFFVADADTTGMTDFA